QSRTQDITNKAAKWLFYVALASGFITLFIWLALGYDFDVALERMVTVMVISCPHALGLAAPLVVAVSTLLSVNHGFLFRIRAYFSLKTDWLSEIALILKGQEVLMQLFFTKQEH